MAQHVFDWLSKVFADQPELIVMFLSALPVSEIRGGVIYGAALHLPLWKVLAIGIPANIISVIPIILLFNWGVENLGDKPLIGPIISYVLKKAHSKHAMVEKYGIWAVTLFVAVPLPVTGAWTGSAIAAVFELGFWKSLGCLALGVIIASSVMSILVYGGVALATIG